MKDNIQYLLRNLTITLSCLLPYLTVAQEFEQVTTTAITATANGSRSVAWVDVNGDGYLDAFISNGPSGGENNQLYINNGDGSFTAKTNDPLVQDGKPSDGTTWGDVDNDGDLDVYVVNWYGQENLFYINDGKGNFTKVTSGDILQKGYSETASWADYDKDGDLDLYVTNSLGNGKGHKNYLIKNNGDGRFTLDNSQVITSNVKDSRSVNWIDYDGDGDLDLFISNEGTQQNQLFKNNGSEGFSEETTGNIVTDKTSSTGSCWADYDNDGDLDLYVANSDGSNYLYKNNNGSFETVSANVGGFGKSYGSIWGDVDNDGDLDLFVANASFGDTKESNSLYLNNNDGTFTRATTGPIATYSGGTFGAAFGDYDNDGDLDLLIANTFGNSEKNALYRNKGNSNHWINISLKGVMSNASAIGAKVRVKATIGGKSVWQMREISSQSGYNCQNSLRAHFGLGDATSIDSLVIEWPLGTKEEFTNVNIDKQVSFQEPVTKGFLRPDFKTEKLKYNIQETVSFINTSVADTSETITYSWDFDNDGTEDSNEKTPSFAYTEAGIYTIKLTIANTTTNKTITRSNYVQILDPNGIGDDLFPDIDVYPNPYFKYFNINLKQHKLSKVALYDVKGKGVSVRTTTNTRSGFTVWCTDLKKGVYFLKVVLATGQRKTFRLVKM